MYMIMTQGGGLHPGSRPYALRDQVRGRARAAEIKVICIAIDAGEFWARCFANTNIGVHSRRKQAFAFIRTASQVSLVLWYLFPRYMSFLTLDRTHEPR